MKKVLLASAVVSALVFGAVTGGSALAAPGKSHTFETIDVMCGGQALTIVTQQNGQWTPAFIVGTHGQPFVPYSFSGDFTDTVTGEKFHFDETKPGNRAGETITCTAHEEEIDGESGHLISGEVTVLLMVRGR